MEGQMTSGRRVLASCTTLVTGSSGPILKPEEALGPTAGHNGSTTTTH